MRNALILLLVSTVASVAIAELTLGYVAPIQNRDGIFWIPDGHIKGRLRPHQVLTTGLGHNYAVDSGRAGGEKYELNRFGFRGEEWSVAKPPGVKRILFLGGSSTFNFHDLDADTWPQITAACLSRELDSKVEALNMSQTGYAIENSLLMYLTQGRYFSPDLVLVYHTWNDLKWLRAFDENPESIFFSKISQNDWTQYLHSLFYGSQVLARIKLFRHRYVLHGASENSYAAGDGDMNMMPSDEAFAFNAGKYRTLALNVAADGGRVLFVKQASLVHPGMPPEYRRHISYDVQRMSEDVLLRSYARHYEMFDDVARDFPQVSVFNAYDSVPGDLRYLEDHVHLTKAGNRLLGELLCEEIKRSNALGDKL